MDVIVQKSAELGAARIVPFVARHSVATAEKAERWRRIARESVKQSGRAFIPEVTAATDTVGVAAAITAHDLTLLLYEGERELTLKQALAGYGSAAENENPVAAPTEGTLAAESRRPDIALIVGPEGGFAAEEVSLLTAAGATSVTLGRTILRTETAAPAALAMLLYKFEL
jgi:16S rRNA (uracil1498-N3)-methyltransferase